MISLTECFQVQGLSKLPLVLVQQAEEATGDFHHFLYVQEHAVQVGQWRLGQVGGRDHDLAVNHFYTKTLDIRNTHLSLLDS